MAKKKFYAVRVGKETGVFLTWAECQKQTKGVSGASFKSFPTYEQAVAFANPKLRNEGVNDKSLLVDLYIDGSFDQSIQKYSFGLVIDIEDRPSMNKSFDDPRFLVNRNVSGELFGAMYGFKWILDHQEEGKIYRINYDYEGIEKWAMGDWKTNKALTKCYAIISKVAMENSKILFNKVPAHAGVELNEVVDQLAKDALNQEPSKIELGFIDFETVYQKILPTLVDN